jgi:hypothetical protein
MKPVLITCLALGSLIKAAASPAADLSSPSPEIRVAAAAKLRVSYRPPPRASWDSLLAKLKLGDARTNVEAILKANAVAEGAGMGGAGFSHISHRLDEAWVLKCQYRWGSAGWRQETLDARSLELRPSYVNVAAPTNFTGVWILYYVNGQKCMETYMKDGVWSGDQVNYLDDGHKWIIKHYEPGSPEIGYTQYYYRSDKVMTRGKVDGKGSRIGMWTNYSKLDGSVVDTYPGWPTLPPH